MDDARVWSFEEGLWTGDAEHYRALIDDECLMVMPTPPYVMSGSQAIEAVSKTPRWSSIHLSDRQVKRPEAGLIILAYKAEARKGDEAYTAHCTTVLRKLAHDEWRVVQHQQTPPITAQPTHEVQSKTTSAQRPGNSKGRSNARQAGKQEQKHSSARVYGCTARNITGAVPKNSITRDRGHISWL